MKQSLENTSGKHYSVKYWSQQNMVEVWSVQRLPFEPKSWLVDLRNDIRTGIHNLQSRPGHILHAMYSSSQASFCDIENVLFYNVGLAHFAALMTTGLRFERCSSCPDSPTPLSDHPLHYHHYSLENTNNGFSCWKASTLRASWQNIEIPQSMRNVTATTIWYHVRSSSLKTLSMPERPLIQFGLTIRVTLPDTITATLASLIKPIIDGVVSAFHTYRGPEIERISQWLGMEVDQTPGEIANLLHQSNQAVLGERRLLHSFRNGFKWNPADDLCLAAELFLLAHSGKDWLLSGELFEIEEKKPLFE